MLNVLCCNLNFGDYGMELLVLIFLIVAIVMFVLWQKEKKKNVALLGNISQYQGQTLQLQSDVDKHYLEVQRYKERYSNIISVDDEIDKRKSKLSDLVNEIATMRADYANKKQTYDALKAQVAIYDEQLEFAHVGMYEPHFDFGTSEVYKNATKENRDQQKRLIQQGQAVIANTQWTVNGSEKEGAKMAKQAIQLTTRSFNNECDATIANTTWKNIERMEERIRKAFEVNNKFNQSNNIRISYEFLDLKINELRLVYEHKLKTQQEKEEQAELRRLEKEEEQLKKEAERAEREEQKLASLLAKIQEKAQHSAGEELERLRAEIAVMGEELKEMQRKNDRVKAMAEQTKLGYVYVISNIGSFGENVFKIGMTRRLEPMDRVRELGDASVPFYFDVHAMVFSEDAPALEAQIQRAFADRRLNLVNYRKEFFHVTLDEIKQKFYEINPKIEFVDEVEAQEFFESVELRKQALGKPIEDTMPSQL